MPSARIQKKPFLAGFAPQEPDTTAKPIYPVPVDKGEPNQQLQDQSPLHLNDPPNIKHEVVYDPVSKQYIFVSKLGDFAYRTPTSMTEKEYME